MSADIGQRGSLIKAMVPRRRWLAPLASVGLALVCLELITRSGLLPSTEFPPLSRILANLARALTEGGTWGAIADTLLSWTVGLITAIVISVPLGLLIGTSRLLFQATRTVLEFCRPIPSVAILPLVVLVFGPGFNGKIFLIVFASVWPILIQTIYGVRDTDPVALDTARSFQVSGFWTFMDVRLMSALPYIVTGVRISSTIALVLAVTAEMIVGVPGLGNQITLSQAAGNYTAMYAFIIMTGLIGLSTNTLLKRVEAAVLTWHPSQRDQGAKP